MSRANNPIKVLKTALKRVNKGWMKSGWARHDPETGAVYVCLEGAVYGYCPEEKHNVTLAQQEAIMMLQNIIIERSEGKHMNIPSFNDAFETTLEDIQEVIKLGIIRFETGYDPDLELDEEEVDELVEALGYSK